MKEPDTNPWDAYSPATREEIFARLERRLADAPGVPAPPARPPAPEAREQRLADALPAHAPGHAWAVPPPADWPDRPAPGKPPTACVPAMTHAQLVVLKRLPEYERHLNLLADLDAARAPPLPLEEARARLELAVHRAPDARLTAHGYAWDVWALGGGARYFAAYAWRPAPGGVEAAPYLLLFTCNCP